MAPSKIEWCDETINPQGWGCWGPGGTPEDPKRCWYCYVDRLVKWPGSDCELCRALVPHWHPERLELPLKWRKPRRIFWGSTSDIFHPFTPAWQIKKVLEAVKATSNHTHIFCTKNPLRYSAYNPWPPNCILLTTVTNQKDADERIPELLRAEARVRGVSHEPLLGDIRLSQAWWGKKGDPIMPWQGAQAAAWLNWAIIGAMTGPGAVKPKPEEVQGLVEQYRAADIPFFLKKNLGQTIRSGVLKFWESPENWPEKIQEWSR